VVTRNWRARLSGQFDQTTAYDVMLYPEWQVLKAVLVDEFTNLCDWLSTQNSDWFSSHISYPSGNKTKTIAVQDALIHIMTHAIHHRGQLSAACTHLGVTSPEMDFVFYRWRQG
jgi:uncharacterized damage-inducible protein DinB